MVSRWKAPETLKPYFFESLLSSLSTSPSKSATAAAHIHSQLLTNGLLPPSSPSGYLNTKLLQLYADGGDLHSALHLFDSLPHPNIFAWTPIIAFLSRIGDHRRSLSTYSRMRAAGIPPDGYVLPVALRAATFSHFAAAALHSNAVKFAATANLHVSNALIKAYAYSGDLTSADRVFASMDRRDLLSWNSMISVFVSAGSTDPALELFRSMASDGYEPDIVTWNTILDGYCRAGRCAEAVEIFNRVKDPNVVSYTTIILGHARSGNHDAAIGIFRRMVSGGAVSPDQDMLSCVVACCRHLGALRAGGEVHAFGLKTLNPVAFYCSAGAALVALYSGNKLITYSRRVFDSMDPTDLMKRNALIAGLTHAGMVSEALDQFKETQLWDVGTDPTTLASVLPACSMIQGKQIHAHAIRNYYDFATEVYNALISVYASGGCITAAWSVFLAACMARDVVTWNAMIAAYGSHGLGGPAIELIREMMRAGLRPNLITFTSVLSACNHAGLVDVGLEWFDRFRNDVGLVPEMVHYACVVDMLGRAGRLEEAVGFIRRMPERAGASVWGALMAASRAHQNVEYGKLAFEELLKVEPENAGNYVAMAGMYGRVGRWEEAKMVRRMMERRCVVKPYGYSRIQME
ncbi:putative pentatricopeptide repeat-containing protein At1g03510 [Phalaenopsis equestris]|uniref:putative pentatricopeptide repeat-containing protein At1g03510 n=1 Tax=Phalaenopsis equestris TaxID=78828 RepID=UPI0009E247DF|nr:putative pentatricopeptide repeat-containing protein At1g03510 [Phalaenopsis equestris]